MKKIMTLLLVALLVFSMIITFSACELDVNINKGDPKPNLNEETSGTNDSDPSSTTKANTSETTQPESTPASSTPASSAPASSTPSSTTGGSQEPNLNPAQSDSEGQHFNPIRPL